MSDSKPPLDYNIADYSNRVVGSPKPAPPPLPPRGRSTTEAPPPYSQWSEGKKHSVLSEQWRSRDPRSSSMQSLVPAESTRDGRRTLLLIYVHGFMGNETSFQSFPAHIHNLLTISMSETHVVHTKIYPRYKSRRAIEFAVEDFSNWLEPHENDFTDVVLLGHSMGGILDVDVALLQPRFPIANRAFRHRILGTINFDTPYLGMHPGLVISGISSLFRSAPEQPGVPKMPREDSQTSSLTNMSASQSTASFSTEPWSTSSGTGTPLSPTQSAILGTPSDPNYNAPYPNDVRIQERKGWSNILHFINKHSDGLTSATKQYFMSHLEFGGCLADFHGLKNRYSKIRALEDVTGSAHSHATRIRFINYYTASTGIAKKPKIKHTDDSDSLQPATAELQGMSLRSSRSRSVTPTPSITVSEYEDAQDYHDPSHKVSDVSPIEAQMENLGQASGVQEAEEDSDNDSIAPMQHIDSMPIPDSDDENEPPAVVVAPTREAPIVPTTETSAEVLDLDDITPAIPSTPSRTATEPSLPPIPTVVSEPLPLDLTLYTDKDSRKLAEKEHKNAMKIYQKQVKDRETAIRDRQKLIEKREKAARQAREKEQKQHAKQLHQDAEKERKAAEKLRMKEAKDEQDRLQREREEAEIRALTINPEPLPPPTTSIAPSSSTPSIAPSTQAGSSTNPTTTTERETKPAKPKKDRKFCLLPSDLSGPRDTCWVRVYMEGVDEVGAHCGLFFQGPQYESLVGDVGKRVEEWVREDARARAAEGA